MTRQEAFIELDLFSPIDHPLPDGGYDMLLEVLDIQDASADLTKARIREKTCTLPGAGAHEVIERCEERLMREVDDYNRKSELTKAQPQLPMRQSYAANY